MPELEFRLLQASSKDGKLILQLSNLNDLEAITLALIIDRTVFTSLSGAIFEVALEADPDYEPTLAPQSN